MIDSLITSVFRSESGMSTASSSERCNVAKYRVSHLLIVESIKSLLARKESIISSQFYCSDEPDPVKFEIRLDFGKKEEGWLSCQLKANKDVFVNSLTFLVEDAGLQPIRNFTFPVVFVPVGHYPGRNRFYELSNHSESYGDGLRFKCDISYDSAIEHSDYAIITERDPYMQDDLMKLFTQPKDATLPVVTFIVGDERVEAHKDILMARSSYFKTLFDSRMLESLTNEIPIEEAEADHFRELLKFLYTGSPPQDLPRIARAMLPLADRYQLITLKSMCVAAVISTLSLANVVSALLLADAHDCPELAKKCFALMKGNIADLKLTEDWKELKKNPAVLMMMVESLAE